MQPAEVVTQVVAVLGRGVVDAAEPVAVADDLGLTRGDGCFDATRLVIDAAGARVDNLAAHLARLARSAARLSLACPDADAWRSLVAQAVAAWPGPGTAVVKLVLTRGSESRPAGPLALVSVTTTTPVDAALHVVTLSRGHAADAFADAPWLLGGVKTLSYGTNVAAQREARARGADDVLFVSTDGYALEGPTSGLVVALGDGLVTTPVGPTGILESITVGLIGAGARREGVAFAPGLLTVAQVRAARGAWLASSVRGGRPIASLDGAAIARDPALDARLERWAGFRDQG